MSLPTINLLKGQLKALIPCLSVHKLLYIHVKLSSLVLHKPKK